MGEESDGAGRPRAKREVVPYIPQMVLRYVRDSQGKAAVGAVMHAAGLGHLGKEAWERTRWWSVAEVVALARAAADQTGDLDIGRRAGETWFRTLRNLNDKWRPATVLDAVVEATEYGSKMSSGCLYELVEPIPVDPGPEGELLFEGRYSEPSRTDRFFCSFTAGYYSRLGSLVGARTVVTEPECQFRGHDRCLFRMRWWGAGEQPAARPTPALAGARAVPEHEMVSLRRFEELQSMAAELVQADDVDTLLQRITSRAGSALQAPRYLLAVRTADAEPLRIHHFGFSGDESAERFASRLLAGEFTARDGVAAVTIASPRRQFGQLAAVFAPGAAVRGYDVRLLEAYAGHAAAALDVVSSLASARRDRDAAEALLGLAHRLTGAVSDDEIALRVSEAVPAVTGAEVGAVWLCEGNELRLAAAHDGTPSSRYAIPIPDAYRSRLAADGTPSWIDGKDVSPRAALMFERTGVTSAALAPIAPSGTLEGIVVAGFRSPPAEAAKADVIARLVGLADHASTAFARAGLVEDMRRQALHDALTGLPNRRLVEDRALMALRTAARSGAHVAVLFLDLDRFKVVNDTMGHAAGDQLIRAVAERLSFTIRSCDTLARLGGDEFVVLATELACGSEARGIAERVIDAMSVPFTVGGQELFVSCSIGIAWAPDHGTDYDTLMRHADAAMYRAKAQGRNTFAVHASAPAQRKHELLQLESQLHRALGNGELDVYYQPQYDLASGAVMGAEALVRWRHPHRGLLLPGEFLPLAEASGLIVAIDDHVRRTAFTDAARWAGAGTPVRMAVNLSTRDLHNPQLVDRLEAQLVEAGLPPALVELEITDMVAMADDDLPAVLDRLRAIGTRLAIDDFGAGNSVFSRLRRCPVDTLKIDRRFVQDITDDIEDAPVVRAIIDMARNLGFTVLAEGVELASQARLLRRYGCELAQGFHFGHPLPRPDFERLLEPAASALPRSLIAPAAV